MTDNLRYCSGAGQFHTNELDASNPDKKLRPYQSISFKEIKDMVNNPQGTEKEQAQWLIPSALTSRNFKAQEMEGQFWLLWADLDTSALPLHLVKKHLISIIGNCQFEIYTSRSATEENQKARILIPLKCELNGSYWKLCQEILNDNLDKLGVTPDRASERTAQLCYLPNRGEYYDSKSIRTGELFNPLERFSTAIEQKQLAIDSAEKEARARREKAEKRRYELRFTGDHNNDLIGAFNEAYTVEDILLKAGYKQRGNTFCHPNSSSGSYAASVKDGRIHSLNGTDPLNTGKGAHDAFSAFCVLFHDNDNNKALNEAGDQWLEINGEPWNKATQREFMANQEKRNNHSLPEDEATSVISESAEDAVDRLAQLTAIEYEQVREAEAKKLKFRTSALDKIVARARKEAEQDNDEVVTSDEPYQGAVNGDELLQEISTLINKHMVLPKAALPAISLWILGTYVYDAFRIFPKLAVISPERRCGKSTLLDILGGLCSRSLMTSNITPSAIFRSVDLWKPALIIDEGDTFISGRNDDLIGIINSGHTKTTAFVIRTVGDDHTPKKFSTWAPMAFASIKGIAGTVMDRSIIIHLRRRTAQEKVQRLPVDFKQDCVLVREKLVKWSEDNHHKLKQNPVEPPEISNDRAIDNWLPLFTIAHALEGKWPNATESSYLILNSIEEEETAAIMLLKDVEAIFNESGKTKIFSDDLVYDLVSLEERPWCEWKKGNPMTQNSLAKILKTFGIHSKKIRVGNSSKRGFEISCFDDAFARYIPYPPIQSGTVEQTSSTKGYRRFQSGTDKHSVPLVKALQASADEGCSTVPLQNTLSEEGAKDSEVFL